MQKWLGVAALLIVAVWSAAQQRPSAPPSKPKVSATAPSADAKLPSEETVNSFMHEMFGYDPAVSWKVGDIRPSIASGLTEVDIVIVTPQGSQPNRFYVTEDGKHAIAGDIFPFGVHPFAAGAEKLKESVTGPAQGPANAPVTVVEFSDLQCPHCKAVQPNLERLLSEDKSVRLVFQNYPLPSHDWAEKGAEYADCIAQSSPDAFWKFIKGVFDSQSDITASNADEKFGALADQSGVKGSDIAVCADKAETAGRVQRSVSLGRSLNVTATPTAFINGRKVDNLGGLPYETLKKMVDFAAQGGK